MSSNIFKRDDRDVQFVLKEHLGVQRLLEFDRFSGFSMEDFDMILDQAMKIAADMIAPSFQEGDKEACRFENGKVTVPASIYEAWQVYRDGGWCGIVMNPEYGGQGVPVVIAEAAEEFFMSANLAFLLYPMMGAGNARLIEDFGSQELKDLFLAKVYDGTWGGTMALTEPGAGSDAHMVTLKAIPDGKIYRIEGTKTFITAGEHNLTENIIHLVIGRIEGAPQGAKGVSLFVIPKIWVNDDGSMGEPNDVTCIGIEHKMGMNGSATCVLNFGENGRCRGYLVGEPGMGLAYMFQKVNDARNHVGLASMAYGTNMYANVLEYAKERVQGKLFGRGEVGDRVRIVEHADIRRMLMNMKSLSEGMRALIYKTYFLEDISQASPDAAERKWARGREDLLVPLVKAYCSDRVFEMGRDAIQIMGGYGYTKEYPIEQYTRDCKIFSIWDGTNYVQSIDLVGRKLNMDGGGVFRNWADEVSRFARENGAGDFAQEMALLEESLQAVVEISEKYKEYRKDGRIDLIPLTSTRFLDCVAEVAVAHLLLEQGLIAAAKLAGSACDREDERFYRGKVETVRYYVRNYLTQVPGRARIIKLEDMSAVDIAEESL